MLEGAGTRDAFAFGVVNLLAGFEVGGGLSTNDVSVVLVTELVSCLLAHMYMIRPTA